MCLIFEMNVGLQANFTDVYSPEFLKKIIRGYN